jgi:hypothetical protein
MIICLYTIEDEGSGKEKQWKFWLKKIQSSKLDLTWIFSFCAWTGRLEMPDNICSFIVASSASISGSSFDDSIIGNTAH